MPHASRRGHGLAEAAPIHGKDAAPMNDERRRDELDRVELRSPLEEFDELMELRCRHARRSGRDDEAGLLEEAWEMGRRLLAGDEGRRP